jgi:hypothetical protein
MKIALVAIALIISATALAMQLLVKTPAVKTDQTSGHAH